jgi:alkanesulfonate monooxygenase
MQNYKTFCPYLVGSYSRVAGELARYISLGFRTVILDIPPDRDELAHTMEVFRRAPKWGKAISQYSASSDASQSADA